MYISVNILCTYIVFIQSIYTLIVKLFAFIYIYIYLYTDTWHTYILCFYIFACFYLPYNCVLNFYAVTARSLLLSLSSCVFITHYIHTYIMYRRAKSVRIFYHVIVSLCLLPHLRRVVVIDYFIILFNFKTKTQYFVCLPNPSSAVREISQRPNCMYSVNSANSVGQGCFCAVFLSPCIFPLPLFLFLSFFPFFSS